MDIKIKFFKNIIPIIYFFYSIDSFAVGCHVAEGMEDVDFYPPYANYTGLGELKNPFCNSDEQDVFFCSNIENGLKLIHNFEYSQGIFNFKIAQKFAPERAIGYALELLSYNQFTGSSILFNKKAQEKSKKILEFLKNENLIIKNDLEKDFINAIKSFSLNEKDEYIELNQWNDVVKQNKNFTKNMCALIEKYPENVEIISFCGLAILRSRNGGYDLEANLEGVKILNKGYDLNPKHPGILHYLIHMVENPIQAHYAKKAGDLYSEIAYNAVHGLHMPAHHFFNIGNWNKIIEKTSGLWDLGEKMKKQYPVKVGSIDNFHGTRWIIYSYLQLGEYDKAFDSIKKMIESGDQEYLDGGAIWDFSQSAALILIEGDLKKDQIDYLFDKLKNVESKDDKFSNAYLIYTKAIFDYRNNVIENFNKYIGDMGKIIEDSENGHPMSLYNLKIIHQQLSVYKNILEKNLNEAEKNARKALEIENEYTDTIFETGPVISLVPSNELLGMVLMKKEQYQEAIDEFLKVELKFPNRLVEKKYIEECNKKF